MLGDAGKASVASDVYSLAMSLVFCLHGRDLPPDVWRRPEAFLETVRCSPTLRAVLGRGIAWGCHDQRLPLPSSTASRLPGREWCEDVRDAAAYRERDGRKDPVSTTGDAAVRCVRGGSWYLDAWFLPAAFRYRIGASSRLRGIGFRCELPAPRALRMG